MTETVSVQGKVRAEFWAQRTRVSVRGMGGGSGAGDADQKLRVLCLHGFTQNGETFRQRTGSIRKQLKKKIDFVFIDAPHDASGAFGDDDASALGTAGDGVGPRAWWLVGENAAASVAATRAARDDDDGDDPTTSSSAAPVRPVQSRQMRGWDDAAAVIADAVEMFGPFDGVLGFSQGASAAALALALVPSLRDTVRFAVLFSGFEPMDPAATAALHAARITVRSMHVHGHADRMVSRERTEALARSFAHPEFFFHEGGHGVPLSKEFRDALRSFALNPAVNEATTTQLATSVTDECRHRSPLAIVHPPLSKPRHSLTPTRFLFVNGVGPCVGVSTEAVRESFGEYGDVDGVDVFDPSMARCVVTMARVEDAIAAQAATHETCRPDLGDRRLWVRFSSDPNATGGEPESRAKQEETWCAATRDSATLGVPGVTLITDFVTEEEEREMLACVDSDERWQGLAKRRVLHYGYAFDYGTRDARDETSPMPAFVAGLLGRAAACGAPGACESVHCDQLTVNEYVAGVGIAPHVDTHSAFGPTILSLSLAGRAVMEFRLHEGGEKEPRERRAISMPPRSLLVLHGEARYRWLHYIPHRKRDAIVGEDECEAREERRVSFTFRRRREGACGCEWPEACDSREGDAQRLKDREGRGLAS